MSAENKSPEWVWVITEKEGENESLLAMEQENKGVKFIPVFSSKEDAEGIMPGLRKKPGAEYTVEAMRLALAGEMARKNNNDIYIVDRDGRIVEALAPIGDA